MARTALKPDTFYFIQAIVDDRYGERPLHVCKTESNCLFVSEYDKELGFGFHVLHRVECLNYLQDWSEDQWKFIEISVPV